MDVETVVIGAGVIGLAVACRLAGRGGEVLVLERADRIGSETSSRNSEVVHAGIYYPPGSLKARLCVEGKHLLYRYCAERGVPARRLGKLIVAVSDDQVPAMRALHERAEANGVMDLEWMDAAAAQRMEPEVRCRAALFSPSSGIVDSHALMLALQGDAEASGAVVVLRTTVTGIAAAQAGFRVMTRSGGDGAEASVACARVVNCAGHGAPEIARSTQSYPAARVPPSFMAKGTYFTVSGKPPISNLIYPMPSKDGLGVHVTLDLAERVRLGPDLHWVDRLDYSLDQGLSEQFYRAVSAYWPGILSRELSAAYSGIRPKISGPEDAPADFMLDGPADHGMKGLVHLFGIESPGLTSSLALADLVADNLARS